MKNIDKVLIMDILKYEVHSSRLSGWVSFEWGQNILGSYYSWKVQRKYKRYLFSIEKRNQILTPKNK